MQEYLTQVERLPDGSLCTRLYGSGRLMHQEPVRNLRHGKRRAFDLLCSAADAESGGGTSMESVAIDPGDPATGSEPAPDVPEPRVPGLGTGAVSSPNPAGTLLANTVGLAGRAHHHDGGVAR